MTSTPSETLHQILHLLPLLLLSSLHVKSFITRWRSLNTKLTLLHSSLHSASQTPHWATNLLFTNLLPNLLSTLHSLHSLSSRCLDPSLPSGKLLLQSDIDISSSTLSLHMHDLNLLLNSGLLNRQDLSNAIVLPIPTASASRAELLLYIKDLFARLQIGAIDLKQKALESLLQLISSNPKKLPLLVSQEGDVGCLIRLLDLSNHSLIRDQAAAAVSLLCTSCVESCRVVYEEGGLGFLLRLLEAGSVGVKEHAVEAIVAITADSSNAWAIGAYSGIAVLIAACKPGGGSAVVRALAVGALKNISAVDDLKAAMVEEGAVPVVVELLVSGNSVAKRNAALCLWSLGSNGEDEEMMRGCIIREGGLEKLIDLVMESSDLEILEHALRAIDALSVSPLAVRTLSSSLTLFTQLSDLIRKGNNATQLIAASLISNCSPSDEIKKSMAGCMASLIKMMESPKPVSAQESAANALVSLLVVRSNRKELSRDEKSIMKLVQMLNPKREEICKKFPVSVVIALAASDGCRKRLVEAGVCQNLQKLVESDVAGAKKALQRIAGSRLKNLFSLNWRE